MNLKLSVPLAHLIKLLGKLEKLFKKKLNTQIVNYSFFILVVTVVILSSQLFIALFVIKVLGL